MSWLKVGLSATALWSGAWVVLGLTFGAVPGRTGMDKRDEQPWLFWLGIVFWGLVAVGSLMGLFMSK